MVKLLVVGVAPIGVPVMAPVAVFSDAQAGRDPAETLNTGDAQPSMLICWLYPVPACAPGRLEVANWQPLTGGVKLISVKFFRFSALTSVPVKLPSQLPFPVPESPIAGSTTIAIRYCVE